MAALSRPEPLPYLPDVYRAICEVQRAISRDGISKGQRNQQQGYSFRGIDQVQNALSHLLAAADLCILPRMLSRTQEERTTAKGGLLFYVTVQADFEFVSSRDGSRHTVTMYGEAMDSGDKATNKAMSAAYKYACLQVFCIPTEGASDADATTHTPEPRYTPAQQAIIEGKLTNVLKTRTDAQPAAQLAAAIPAPHEDDTRYTYTPAEDEPTELEIQMGESIAQIEEQKARRGMLAAFQEIEQRYRRIAYHPTFGAILGRYSVQQPEQFTDIEEARACHREMRYDLEKREKAYAQKWGAK